MLWLLGKLYNKPFVRSRSDDVGLDITRPISIKKHPNGVQNSPITMGIVSIPPMTKTPPTTNILVFAIVNTHPMYAFIIFRLHDKN